MKWSPEDWARLGALIRKSREQQGYSRKRLSEMSGVSEKSIQLIEEGRVPTRWPKSLDTLEEALGWGSGWMARVLDGHDPQSALLDNSSTPAGGAPVVHEGAAVNARLTVDARAAMIASLPEPVRRRLRDVLSFARTCVEYGAAPQAANAFDAAVNNLLLAVLNGPGEQSDAVLISYLENSPVRPWSNAMQPHVLGPAVARRLEQMASTEGQLSGAELDAERDAGWRLISQEPMFGAPKSLRESVTNALVQERVRNRIMHVQAQLLSRKNWGKPETQKKLQDELKQLEEALKELQEEQS